MTHTHPELAHGAISIRNDIRAATDLVQVMTEDGPTHEERVVGAYTTAYNDGYEWTFQADTSDEVMDEIVLAQRNPERVLDSWARRTIYGGPAWGSEDEHELACFEADCYGEPRPNPLGFGW